MRAMYSCAEEKKLYLTLSRHSLFIIGENASQKLAKYEHSFKSSRMKLSERISQKCIDKVSLAETVNDLGEMQKEN